VTETKQQIFIRRSNDLLCRRYHKLESLNLRTGLNLEQDLAVFSFMNYQNIITIEPGKRGGKPCIRRMRITVYDVLGWLSAGMSHTEILDDFPELTEEDIRACLEFAADREHRLIAVVGEG